MASRLKGKTCFVTGSAQGIGRSIVEFFLAEEAVVVAADLHFTEKHTHPRLSHLTLDVTNETAVAAAAESHQGVSVLVNCVGYVADGALLDCSVRFR